MVTSGGDEAALALVCVLRSAAPTYETALCRVVAKAWRGADVELAAGYEVGSTPPSRVFFHCDALRRHCQCYSSWATMVASVSGGYHYLYRVLVG